MEKVETQPKKASRRKLTKKQRDFVNEYADSGNGTEAALIAYDTDKRNVAETIGSENLSKPIIQAELERLGFEENNAKRVVATILNDPTVETQHRLKAAEQVFKVHGSYAAEKHVNVNVSISQEERNKILGISSKIIEEMSHGETT